MQLLFYTLILPILLVAYVTLVRKTLPPLKQSICDTVVIAVTCVLMFLAILPPEQKIKLGRDLRGGVSLIYSVNIPEGADKQETLTQTIKVLKQRINPQGVLDLAILPQGDDRLEVVMPLPGDTVRAAQKAYTAKLAELVKSAHLTPRELDQALVQNRAVELGGADTARREALAALQAAFDKAREARRKYEAAPTLNLTAEQVETLAAETAEAEVAYDAARAAMRTGSISAGRLTR
ncbi:MAG: hypothetical protein JNK53_08760, partial [Phycisphaerae bacterium]|nr:hypothetical protein [Phycisphaerae bacterium]